MSDRNTLLAAQQQTEVPSSTLQEIFHDPVPTSVSALMSLLRGDLGLQAQANALAPTLETVYRKFMDDVDDEERKLIFLFVVQQVQECALQSDALLPFSRYETNYHLVSDAVAAYLQHKRGTLEEPLLAVSVLLEQLRNRQFRNTGAAFAGLVCFGDRRVCSVLRTVRDELTIADIRAFAQAASGPVSEASVEFCIDWLVDLADTEEYEKVVNVASAIVSMVVTDASSKIYRPYPNFGPFLFSNANRFEPGKLDVFLDDVEPLLETLRRSELPTIVRMIEMISNPVQANLDELDRRKQSTRRKRSDRRVSDRRIVSIKPLIDRRADQRRDGERRQEARR